MTSASEQLDATGTRPLWQRVDVHLLLALALAAAVVIPRSCLIASAHSPSVDDDYHLVRGLKFLQGTLGGVPCNDPPLGEALIALPLLLLGEIGRHSGGMSVFFAWGPRAETVMVAVAAWKAVLFVPFVGLVFHWCRMLHGRRAGWLAAVVLIFEPNFAAHIPVAALDVLAVELIVLDCYLLWRYVREPDIYRALAAAGAMAAALMIKHTAVLLPGVAVAMALIWWVVLPWRDGTLAAAWAARRRRAAEVLLVAVMVPVGIWVLTGFDWSPPPMFRAPEFPLSARLQRLGRVSMPAGMYVGSFIDGLRHARYGHRAYLLGMRSATGWWYYFPVVTAYKAPVGVGVLAVAALVSLRRRRPAADEWSLLLPMAVWGLFLMASNLNIGFRHFLPAYVFALMWSARAAAGPLPVAWVAWAGALLAAVHGLSWHPNYVSYINLPWPRPHLAISDSNIDWGHSLPQVRRWIDSHPSAPRPVHIIYFGRDDASVRYYLGKRAIQLPQTTTLPRQGTLIISAVHVAGTYQDNDAYAALRRVEPVDRIANCMFVYDLSRVPR